MNILDGLERIRERLEANQARPETLRLVDTIAKTASQPGANQAQVRSLLELVRRLMRTPAANSNVGVYDDLALLEEQLATAAAEAAARREALDNRPIPKPKKYYRELKEREARKRTTTDS
ncbi:MAG: hypothetical protein QJR03_15950 [Sphaerobacter sp.]|nr:hypothetical protein [Sphaerobacter sp.]